MTYLNEIHAGANIGRHGEVRDITKKYSYLDKSFPDHPARYDGSQHLDQFQKAVHHEFINGRNIFIAASPAAGKTRPITTAILDIYNQSAATGQQIPRVLVSVPLSQLAQQTQDDYVDIFIKLFTARTPGYSESEELLKMANIASMFPNQIQQQLLLILKVLYRESNYNDLITFIKTNLVGVATQGSPNRPSNTSIIDIGVVELAAKQAATKKYEIVIIDEVQQLFQEAPTEYDETLKKDVGYYDTIFKKCSNSQFAFLTGSLAGKTTENFIDHLQDYYKIKHIRLMSAKTMPHQAPSKNRSELRVVPYEEMGDGRIGQLPRLANVISERVQNNIKYNALILFSKANIYKLCYLLIDKIQPKSIIGQMDRGVKTQEDSSDPWTFKQPFGRSVGQVSKTGSPFQQPKPTRTRQSTLDKSQVSRFGDYQAKQRIKVGQRQFISNELLAQCLVRGFGFIIGGQKRDIKTDIQKELFLEYEDKKLVQELFKNGKIKFILATDAVGIGVNMIVQHLYIPTLHKFSTGRFAEIDTSSLIQLIHRAGRGAVPTAFIYTPPGNVEKITELIAKDPTETVDIVDIDRLKNVTPINKLLLLLKQMSRS